MTCFEEAFEKVDVNKDVSILVKMRELHGCRFISAKSKFIKLLLFKCPFSMV